jgi:hypothetical protein
MERVIFDPINFFSFIFKYFFYLYCLKYGFRKCVMCSVVFFFLVRFLFRNGATKTSPV